jgi:hypothetical protein
LNSPPGTAAGTAESTTTTDPEKNATSLPGAAAGATTTTGQPPTEKEEETTALGIARGEEIIADRVKKNEERYLLAREAATYFKDETAIWRASSEKMQEEQQKLIEGREEIRYGDIFKPNPDPPVLEEDEEVDKPTVKLINRIADLIRGANYYKSQLKAARESTEKLKDDELKAKLTFEQSQFGNLFTVDETRLHKGYV